MPFKKCARKNAKTTRAGESARVDSPEECPEAKQQVGLVGCHAVAFAASFASSAMRHPAGIERPSKNQLVTAEINAKPQISRTDSGPPRASTSSLSVMPQLFNTFVLMSTPLCCYRTGK